jgi:hypothetical protein
MIIDKEVNFIENEVAVTFHFQSENISFDYLRRSEEDDDYVLYLKMFDVIKKIYSVQRFWIKTTFSDLRNKKIVFNDLEENNMYLTIWFYV